MHTLTLRQLQQGLEKGDFSARELAEHFLNRIKQLDPQLNSFITVTEKQALAQADAADTARHKGQAGPLNGLPIAHKDMFCTQGVKTSAASKMLDNFISPYNATVVQKMADAGAVMLGKTNMDEFAMGASSESSFYGAVKNPWNTDYVPGGSSSGSAAAVAARLVPAATGSDTAGSVRQPASLTGLTGIKPTYGRVSRFGMVALASSMDQAGLLAQNAEDCALLLNIIAGHDANESTSSTEPVPDYLASLNNDLSGVTIGIVDEFFTEQLNTQVADNIAAVIKTLESLGAKTKRISLPLLTQSTAIYHVLANAEASSNLSRFDGVRFGYRCDNPTDLEDLYVRSRSEAFGREVKRRLLLGTYMLSESQYQKQYVHAQKVRRLLRDQVVTAFSEVDLLIGPTSPTTAFKLGEKAQDPLQLYLADRYANPANLAGLPAISFASGFINNLPVGCQLMGNYFNEGLLLNIAHRYQQQTNWHTQLPTIAQGGK